MSKNKKSTRGGRRPGAGRKATGVNWVYCGFSVHKDDLQIIKELVKGKKKELDEKRKSGIIEQMKPHFEKASKSFLKLQSAIIKEAPLQVPVDVDLSTQKKLKQSFLDKRRNQKLGIK